MLSTQIGYRQYYAGSPRLTSTVTYDCARKPIGRQSPTFTEHMLCSNYAASFPACNDPCSWADSFLPYVKPEHGRKYLKRSPRTNCVTLGVDGSIVSKLYFSRCGTYIGTPVSDKISSPSAQIHSSIELQAFLRLSLRHNGHRRCPHSPRHLHDAELFQGPRQRDATPLHEAPCW